MASDPLSDFVNGNYPRTPSRAHVNLAIALIITAVPVFALMSIFVGSLGVNEIRPALRLDTAEAVVVSKRKARRLERKHGRGFVIQWSFVDGYDPDKTSFSGYDNVSWVFARSLDVGDIIRVQYHPTKSRRADNVRIKGSFPLWYLFLTFGTSLVLMGLTIAAFFRARLALTNRPAFINVMAKNLGLKSP